MGVCVGYRNGAHASSQQQHMPPCGTHLRCWTASLPPCSISSMTLSLINKWRLGFEAWHGIQILTPRVKTVPIVHGGAGAPGHAKGGRGGKEVGWGCPCVLCIGNYVGPSRVTPCQSHMVQVPLGTLYQYVKWSQGWSCAHLVLAVDITAYAPFNGARGPPLPATIVRFPSLHPAFRQPLRAPKVCRTWLLVASTAAMSQDMH